MAKSHEFAWAAGFFDGEGWIKIQKRGSTNNKYLGFYLRVGINHVKKDPLEKMHKLFGGSLRYDTNVRGNRHPRWVWTLSTKQAEHALRCMTPYLLNKHEEAALALEFQGTVGQRGQVVPKEVQLYRYLLADRIKHVNSLG